METPEEPRRHRIDPPDEVLIRAIMRTPPAQRIGNMLRLQKAFLRMWRDRLRRSHPHLSDLELTRLTFERLGRNG